MISVATISFRIVHIFRGKLRKYQPARTSAAYNLAGRQRRIVRSVYCDPAHQKFLVHSYLLTVQGRMMRPPVWALATTVRTISEGTAKPMPIEPPLRE